MKFLFITTFNPFNHSSGGNQRSYLLCKSLCDIGEVDVITIGPNREVENKTLPCNNLGTIIVKSDLLYKYKEAFVVFIKCLLMKEKCCYAKNRYLTKCVKDILASGNYDFVVVRYMKTVYAAGLENMSNLIVDIDDLPHLAFNACVTSVYNGFIRRICEFMEYRIESDFLKFSKKNIPMFVSDGEKILDGNMSFLPNIPIDDDNRNIYMSCSEKKNILFFVGLLSYKPNYLGLDYFIDNIWNQVIKIVPDAILKIAGKDLLPYYRKKWSLCKGIKLLGYVDDLVSEYRTSKVFISPIYTGGGTNIKILEAIKYNIPIVASPFSIRGYSSFLKNGANIFIAKDDDSFVQCIITLLQNDKLCRSISDMALKSMSKLYSYSSFCSIVNECVNRNLNKRNNGL